MSNTKTVFTTGEAAKICKVSQQTIIRCFDNGTAKRFPSSRLQVPAHSSRSADPLHA